ncbi:MAG TPA: hypothetical protein PKH10_02200 [bacterium]|nr:hypothetical protein [bacterium]
MFKHFYRLMVVALAALFVTLTMACAGGRVINNDLDTVDHGVADEDVFDEDIADSVDMDVSDLDVNDPDVVKPDDDIDADSSACDNGNIGKNCKTDNECGSCLICVNAKCAEGCQSDADCLNYAGTKCNRALSRCLNTTATDSACGETKCSSGCCYGTKGFLSIKCLSTATLQTCGICKQGEIYMDGKQCVPSACKVGESKCQTYNATVPNSQCFSCDEETFLCQSDPNCAGADVCEGCEFGIQGTVMNAQGDTLTGIEVVAYAGTSFETSVRTGATGIFKLDLQSNYGCDIGEPETIPLIFNDTDGVANGGNFESKQVDAVLPWTESLVNPCTYQKMDLVIALDEVGNNDDILFPDE